MSFDQAFQSQIQHLISLNSSNEEGREQLQRLSVDDHVIKLFMDYCGDQDCIADEVDFSNSDATELNDYRRPRSQNHWATIASVIIKSMKSDSIEKLKEKINDFYKKLEVEKKEMQKQLQQAPKEHWSKKKSKQQTFCQFV